MAWLRLDDGFAQHPKLEGWTAPQKWALIELFCYCARHKTEGHVPDDLSLLPRAVTQSVLALAEESGIIDRDEDALTIHDWSVYNPSDPTAAERMKRLRENRNAKRNADRNEGRNESVSSRARLPSRPTEASNDASGKRDRDDLWDALVAEIGDVETKDERGARNHAVKQLRDIGATPEDVRRRCAQYRRTWPDITLTDSALVKHWSRMSPSATPDVKPVDEVLGLPEADLAENAKRAAELAARVGSAA